MIATGCYAGKLPWVPGTWGSLAAVPLFYLLFPLSPLSYSVVLVGFFSLAVWSSSVYAAEHADNDPKEVVIDEVVGLLVAFAFHGWSAWLVVGFILFRFFDVWKPFPARQAEQKFPSGWGIVMDDVIAGIYANLTLWLIRWVAGMIA